MVLLPNVLLPALAGSCAAVLLAPKEKADGAAAVVVTVDAPNPNDGAVAPAVPAALAAKEAGEKLAGPAGVAAPKPPKPLGAAVAVLPNADPE